MYNFHMEIKKQIYNKLKKLTNKKFNDESDIFSIGIDSLDLVELVTEAEDEFEITISDEELAAIKTVGDIAKTFEKNKK